MSEDFDKEAERRRLREKYEEEREDREATERMSDLLLKGATMTNKHCDTCGSPIFRYQGQEFCPKCQAAAEEGAANGEAAVESEETVEEPTAPAQTGQPARQQPAQPTSQEPTQGMSQQPSPSASDQRVPIEDATMQQVRASLTRTLATFAQRAAETDDPHRAREYLETAKSAAETLRALPQ